MLFVILLVLDSGFFIFFIFLPMDNVGVLKDKAMICAPLMCQSVEQVVKDMHMAKAQGADLVEIRLDFVSDLHSQRDLKIILTNKPLPVIIVYRY